MNNATPQAEQEAFETIDWFIMCSISAFSRMMISHTKDRLSAGLNGCSDKVRQMSLKSLAGDFHMLDLHNQVSFLKIVCDNELDLGLPDIPDYKQRALAVYGDDSGAITMEEIRPLVHVFQGVKESDWWPQDLIWVRDTCLYFNNNSTPDNQYGNFINWANYYKGLKIEDRKNICSLIQNYFEA